MSLRVPISVLVILLCGISSTTAFATTGTLTTPVENGIVATGVWNDPEGGTRMTYTVVPVTDGWQYTYKLEVPSKEISHFIIETSLNYEPCDLDYEVLQGTVGKIETGWFLASNPSNPGIPDNIHGIKFDGAMGTTVEVTFFSPRMPVWGDFYSKDGQSGGNWNACWNSGFTASDADPMLPYWDTSVTDHILVPDTDSEETMVPEPSSWMALLIGLPGLVHLRKRRA